jgi:hypothetical protein
VLMVVLLCVRATSGDGFTTATNVTYPIRHFPLNKAHVILKAPSSGFRNCLRLTSHGPLEPKTGSCLLVRCCIG